MSEKRARLAGGILCAVFMTASAADKPSSQDWRAELTIAPRTPKAGRTLVFCRGQLKYGLKEANGPTYIGRWVDRPLFIDPDIPKGPEADRERPQAPLWFNDYVAIQKILKRYELDGFAFFPGNGRCAEYYALTPKSPVPDFLLLSELGGGRSDDLSALMGRALACPNSLLLDGKLVLVSYNADQRKPEYWKELMNAMRREHGDRLVFISSIIRPAGTSWDGWGRRYRAGQLTRDDAAAVKAYLRTYLRATDGIQPASLCTWHNGKGGFAAEFYREFAIPVCRSVLAEPEFTNKFFALSALVGHENASTVGTSISHDGTKTLRNTMEAAMAGNPDIIHIPEWDEQNENTSLRPTVYNGLSSMRIMRFYMARLKKEPLRPMPGDNLSIPDLTVSYRKLLCLGEKIEVELLNVPDSQESFEYTVRLSLKAVDGTVAKAFPAQALNAAQMKAVTLVAASEALAEHQVLIPRLDIEYQGRHLEFEDGLHYIQLRPTWNWDYKCVKQPLRDLLIPAKARFEQVESPDRLLRSFAGEIAAPEELAYVEVLDNDDVVFVAEADGAPFNAERRESREKKIFEIGFQAPNAAAAVVTGRLRVTGAPCNWENGEQVHSGTRVGTWGRGHRLVIAARDVDRAVLEIDLPDLYTGKIPLRKILDDQTWAAAGPRGLCMSINRFIRQSNHPSHLNRKRIAFDVDLIPDLKTSVIHMQAIAKSGKTYRSKPILMYPRKPSARAAEIVVFSDTREEPVRVKLDAERIPVLDYRFAPEHGAALLCDEGRALWGIVGGYGPRVTMRNGAESGAGTPYYGGRGYPKENANGPPRWVRAGDTDALEFQGSGAFAVLPQGAIPRRAGFELELQIMPDDVTGRQMILGNRTFYPGALSGVFLDGGVVKAEYVWAKADSGMTIPAGKWSSVRIRYDQAFISFEVNGRQSEKFKCRGPGLYDTVTAIGGWDKDWFRGKIRRLKITHSVAPQSQP
ncbi:MAG: hypothetical protein JXR37_28525 [Kiritimatiellae bacterium]|nr:hypothetical protein [Kiritimatiellia bacterium]